MTVADRSGRRLLIVEESLKGHRGHEFSYARSVVEFNQAEGVDVEVAVHAQVETTLEWSPMVHPIFHRCYWHGDYPNTYWHGVRSKKRRRIQMLWRILLANLRFRRELAGLLRARARFDLVFAPMVIPHQALGWLLLMLQFTRRKIGCAVMLLRFNAADSYAEEGQPRFGWFTRIFGRCLRLFRPLIWLGHVRFVTDSEALAREYHQLTGIPFAVLPSPQIVVPPDRAAAAPGPRPLVFSAPGLATYIKGIDVLMDAIRLLRDDPPATPIRFVIMWSSPAVAGGREPLEPDDELTTGGFVEYVRRTLTREEYYDLLHGSDCILLPYRVEGYRARTSGVLIEAATAGIPVIVAAGTTLEEGMRAYGAGLVAAEGNAAHLAQKIREFSTEPQQWRARAIERATLARDWHSPTRFQQKLWGW